MEKIVLEREHAGRYVILCLLPCVLYSVESEFEKIITKICLSIKATTTNCIISFIDLY